MKNPKIQIKIALGLGKGRDRVLTCDLTKEYVAIQRRLPVVTGGESRRSCRWLPGALVTHDRHQTHPRGCLRAGRC